MHVRMLRVRLGMVLGRHPKINLFGSHYCVICFEVETKLNFLTPNDVTTKSRKEPWLVFAEQTLNCLQICHLSLINFYCLKFFRSFYREEVHLPPNILAWPASVNQLDYFV